MTRFISIIALLAGSLVASAQTAKVTLAWDANPEPDVMEYRVYVGTESGTYGSPVVVKAATQQELDLAKGTMHYAVVTAVNTSGLESVPSAELAFQVFAPGEGVVPSSPANVHKLNTVKVSIQQSPDLRNWMAIHSQQVVLNQKNAFFRLELAAQ